MGQSIASAHPARKRSAPAQNLQPETIVVAERPPWDQCATSPTMCHAVHRRQDAETMRDHRHPDPATLCDDTRHHRGGRRLPSVADWKSHWPVRFAQVPSGEQLHRGGKRPVPSKQIRQPVQEEHGLQRLGPTGRTQAWRDPETRSLRYGLRSTSQAHRRLCQAPDPEQTGHSLAHPSSLRPEFRCCWQSGGPWHLQSARPSQASEQTRAHRLRHSTRQGPGR